MIKNLTNVRGIQCWGAHIGIKSMRRDLAIIYSEVPASAACTFTQNEVVAEPVKISREHMKGGKAQAIVCNAGNANATENVAAVASSVLLESVISLFLQV